MPYFVASIMTITSALIILMTRYEADDSTIVAELDRVKSMFVMIDGFVNTYIKSGGDLSDINFDVLFDAGILPGNVRKRDPAEPLNDNIIGDDFASILSFPRSVVRWQIIPIRDIAAEDEEKDFASSSGSAYKILVDMSENRDLSSKGKFSESFAGREFCEKMLFGTLESTRKTYVVPSVGQENFSEDGTDSDGIFVCIVFK